MKISNSTGEIFIPPVDVPCIGPELSRSGFLDSPFGKLSEPVVKNDPYYSFMVPDIHAYDTTFNLSLQFWDDLLQAVEIVDCHQRFESKDWCEDIEMLRKKEHERLLKQVWSMPPGHYNWGNVASVFDRRCGCSMIFISYGD